MKFSVFLLVLLTTTAQAEVYKSVNADGEVIYSDVPSRGAQPVHVPELPTYTPVPLPVAQPPAAVVQPVVEDSYSSFSLTRPHNNETIHPSDDGPGVVNVFVKLEPELMIQDGHRIQYFLDDKPQGKPLARMSTSYPNVDRGTHSVSAAVLDDSGEIIIKTTPVTIYIRR